MRESRMLCTPPAVGSCTVQAIERPASHESIVPAELLLVVTAQHEVLPISHG